MNCKIKLSPVGSILSNFSDLRLSSNCNFLKNGPTPASFIGYFRSFQINITIYVKKYPSSIRCLYSNPRPSDHESPPITTRPGLPPVGTLYLVPKEWCLRGTTIAQWIHLRLSTFSPRFNPKAQYLFFFNLYLSCNVTRTEIDKNIKNDAIEFYSMAR